MLKRLIAPFILRAADDAPAGGFTLHSPTITPGGTLPDAQVFNGMGCTGQNLSPALRWRAAPQGTKSFAITVYDPDAPTGSGWWHWVLINLPASTTELPEGAGSADGSRLPAGALQGRSDYGTVGFGGAAPPPGNAPHRYVFTVYALKTERIDVPADASAAMIGFNIHANLLAQASFTARYGR
jgi:Raf kinase inhibitor-like YbhB/YbcL family protein